MLNSTINQYNNKLIIFIESNNIFNYNYKINFFLILILKI